MTGSNGSIGRHRAVRGRRRPRARTWAATFAGAAVLALGVATQVDGSPVSVEALTGSLKPQATSLTAPVASPTASTTPAPRPRLTAAWRGEAAVKMGGTLTVRGSTQTSVGLVTIEQRVGRAWKPVATAKVTPQTAGGDDFSPGTWSTTVTAPKTPSFQTYRANWAHGGRAKGVAALPRVDVHRVHTYVVATRGEITADVDEFTARAAAIYADKRGWKQAHHRFSRVSRGGDFTLTLTEAGKVPSFDSRCSVHYSCRSGRNVIINEKNWLDKTPNFVGDLDTYRAMVINHETGHWLGMGHLYCAGKGRVAPVMQQQSKGMQGCKANGWPTSAELKAVTR